MRFKNYLNENLVSRILLKGLKGLAVNAALTFLEKQWEIAKEMIEKYEVEDEALEIINRSFKTRFHSLDDINRKQLRKMLPESNNPLNEDLKHWWEMVKDEGFPTLSFYPALQAWMELGKLFDGPDTVNWERLAIYSAFWAAIVSGKYFKAFMKWKKQNPKEYYKERPKLAKKHGIKIEEL